MGKHSMGLALYCIGKLAPDPPNPSSEARVLIRGLLSNLEATTTHGDAWLFPGLLRLDVM